MTRKFFSKKFIYRLGAGVVASVLMASSFGSYAKAEEEEPVLIEESIDSENDLPEIDLSEIDISENETEDVNDVSEDNNYEVVSATENGIVYTDIGGMQYKAVSYNGSSSYINIPEKVGNYTVTVIGENFLNNYSGKANVTSVSIPYTVTEIQKNAFKDCKGLTSVTFGTYTGRTHGFWSDYYVATNLTTIGDYAFYGDSKLGQIDVSAHGLTTIGSYAFAGCTSVSTLKLANSVTRIGQNAFADCTGINQFYFYGEIKDWFNMSFGGNTKETFPNYYAKEVYIGEFVDEGWGYGSTSFSQIESLEIPSGVTEIKPYLFAGFKKLKNVKFANTKTIDEYAFYNCVGLTSVDLTNVNTIKEGAFYNCASITKATFGQGLSTLGAYAFYGNAKLVTVNIQNGLSSISSKAFAGCSTLNDITIHSNVSNIASDAFDNCDNLLIVNVYTGSAADKFFSSRANVWVKYLDSNVGGTQIGGRLVGYSALYDGRIGMHFYFSTSGIDKNRDYVRFSIPSDNGTEISDKKFSEAELVDGKYMFTIYVAPKYCCSDIGAKVVVNGVGDSQSYWISFVDYCNTVLTYQNTYIGANNDAGTANQIKLLIQALLTYCDAAAKYFGCDTSDIKTNMLLPENQLQRCTSYGLNITDPDYIGASMVLNESFSLKLYYKGDKRNITVKESEKLYATTASSFINVEYNGGYTVVTISGLTFDSASRYSSKTIPLSLQLNINYGNGRTDSVYGCSYFYLAEQSGNEALRYLSRAMYTVYSYSSNRTTDLQVK